MSKKIETETEIFAPKFTKEQILQSKTYSNRKDAVNTILEDYKEYSLEEVDVLIEKFMKGKVNN